MKLSCMQIDYLKTNIAGDSQCIIPVLCVDIGRRVLIILVSAEPQHPR